MQRYNKSLTFPNLFEQSEEKYTKFNEYYQFSIDWTIFLLRVRAWKVLQKFGSHKGANALSKGSLLRVAGRGAQIWYCATMRNLWTPAKPDLRQKMHPKYL